jgi:hypothetical protein
MIPLRLVFDTNIVVQPPSSPMASSSPRFCFPSQSRQGSTSPNRFRRNLRVLARPEFKIRKGGRGQADAPAAHSRRPDDNIFLECADAARADYLVTGKPWHFPKFWKDNQGDHLARIHQRRGAASCLPYSWLIQRQ